MLELRTTFLEAAAEAGPDSPLNMVHGAAGPQATLQWEGQRERGPTSAPGPLDLGPSPS